MISQLGRASAPFPHPRFNQHMRKRCGGSFVVGRLPKPKSCSVIKGSAGIVDVDVNEVGRGP